MKIFTWVLGAIVIIGGVLWYLQSTKTQDAAMNSDMGTYAYVCDNGSEFSMSPSADVSEITLEAGAQALFTGTIKLAKMGDAAHFETTTGPLVVFSGAGEEVQLTVGEKMAVCNPKPSTDMAPWNWGDPGEGGGLQQDLVVIVSESILGKWQATDDPKSARIFMENGTVTDWYENKSVSTGTWKVFTKEKPVTVAFPIEPDTAYLQLTMSGTQADNLNFKVTKMTPDQLELIYMDRGGVLTYTRVE
ncbi:MAG: hypothetical protein HYS26_03705 [Candidatus Kaiserbacteria bacterium]|nr:MAG: hypothetical protein HYS26_03705 [Candidatus Kaiserbacteria bacterium]